MAFPQEVPLLPVRDRVVFPHAILPLVVGRPKSVEALDAAETSNGFILIATQKNAEKEEIKSRDIYRVGTLSRILQVLRLPNNYLKVVVEGIGRARITRFASYKDYFRTQLEIFPEDDIKISKDFRQDITHVVDLFKGYVKDHPELPDELYIHAEQLDDFSNILDFIALNVDAAVPEKQKILETPLLQDRLRLTIELLNYALGYQHLRRTLDTQVRENMMRSQREYYLQEQLRIIKKELGEDEHGSSEIAKLEESILNAAMPPHAFDKASEELEKLRKTPPFSPEYTVTRNYLDWMIQVPWSEESDDRINLE
ncbi:MAG: LON peptidase substrate-binding domain-containing protein, partial [Calditrichia bacterium]